MPPDIEVRNKTWLPSHVTGVLTKFFRDIPQLVLPARMPKKQLKLNSIIKRRNFSNPLDKSC